MSALIRRCWPIGTTANGDARLTVTHLFPETEWRYYGSPWLSLCGTVVPLSLRTDCPEEYRREGLITDPGPEVETRPCRRCQALAAAREDRHG